VNAKSLSQRLPGVPKPKGSLLGDPTVRAVLFQVLLIGGVVWIFYYLISNTLANLDQQQIDSGFGFLDREAGFPIGDATISYSPTDDYGHALLVGVLNTVRVSVLGIFLATVLGTIVGVARLSPNWLLRRLATGYVETLRNIPLLLQLFFWYAIITELLPHPRDALGNPDAGIFLSNRGLTIPWPTDAASWTAIAIALLVGVLIAFDISARAKRRQEETGALPQTLLPNLALIIGLPALTYLAFGPLAVLETPTQSRFNVSGGITLKPEFTALLLGLTLYTGAFIAEIVRAGILAVSHGQTEAASALGLRRSQILRLIILPQALRIIIPPTTSQYLNLTKNSSLAVAIGYPDLVSVGNTTMNQTGQAIEAVAIFMSVYLGLSISISIFMNWYNARIALKER